MSGILEKETHEHSSEESQVAASPAEDGPDVYSGDESSAAAKLSRSHTSGGSGPSRPKKQRTNNSKAPLSKQQSKHWSSQ